jgi:CRISPR system Cascade subunit CasC
MTTFIQVHTLTAYPPSCLNRDIAGRPKTSVLGGVDRLRVSSQSLKRALRTSPAFQQALNGHLGERTRAFREEVRQHLLRKGASAEKALEVSQLAGSVFSSAKDDATGNVLSFIAPNERADILARAEKAAAGDEVEFLAKDILKPSTNGVDVALFGRFLTDSDAVAPAKKKSKGKKAEAEVQEADEDDLTVAIPAQARRHAIVDAACQVAHAITTHKASIETDFWSAVDDSPYAKSGAGHIDEAYFGSGVFYGYWCMSRDKLISNLGGNEDLADRAIEALLRALPHVVPSGRITSYAHNVRPALVMVERGTNFPRSLADAFVKPVRPGNEIDLVGNSVAALLGHREQGDAQFGAAPERMALLVNTVSRHEGTIEDLVKAARGV